MRDPVALAWSGRIPEARALALEQAESGDALVVPQGLEALGVLGREHGVRADARMERLLVTRAEDESGVARRAFEAAMGLESRALEGLSARLLAQGEARWEVLRYAGELPSLVLARALAQGWRAVPDELQDEALLTACAMPAANRDECAGWGERALAQTQSARESVRVAAFTAVRIWAYAPAAARCTEALEDESPAVRREAARALAAIRAALDGEQAKPGSG